MYLENKEASKLIKKCEEKIFKDIDIQDEVKDLFLDFLKTKKATKQPAFSRGFVRCFLSNRIPKSKDDFSDKTFYEDIKMCGDDYLIVFPYTSKRKPTAHEKALFKEFYIYLMKNKYGKFNVLNENIISHNTLYKLVLNDYKIVKYDNFQDIPFENKWILIYKEKLYPFDFSCFTGLKQIAMKNYIWSSADASIPTKYGRQKYYRDFLSLLEDTIPLKVNPKNIMDFKNLVKNERDSSLAVRVNSIKWLVTYFEKRGYLEINPFVKKMLSSTNVKSKPNTRGFTKDNINKIFKELNYMIESEQNQNKKIKLKLVYVVIYYLCHTGLRSESIMDLTLDSFHQEQGVYFYTVHSKSKEREIYNVSENVKKLHDYVIRETKEFRKNVEVNLFIYPGIRNSVNRRITATDIREVLNAVCIRLNIEDLGIAGLRNYFMSETTKHVIDKGGDTAILEAVTKHSLNVHYNNYFENDMNQLCLQMYGVYIGDIELKGIVTEKKIDYPKRQVVQSGCGFCEKLSCEDKTKMDCLMCRHFITSPENIPFFENEIKKLDKQIYAEDLPHEKEFLINKKSLYVKYLNECYRIKEAC